MVPDHADPTRGLTVREVTLRDFRSYARLELELEPGLVLLHGPNGAGKTNLLEALHVGTQGFSPRARRDVQMVSFGSEVGRVALRGSNGETPFASEVVVGGVNGRRARLNGEVLSSAERLRHELRTLVFTPDRLAVVKGAPAVRRAYLDRSVGRLFPARASVAVEYAAALGQRNAALRRLAAGASSQDALGPWSERVVSLGADLVDARLATLAELSEAFSELADRLGLERASLAYAGEPVTAEELESRLERDVRRGVTGAGPHVHDVIVESRSRDLRSFGSQGEQRTAVLALVLAEAAVIKRRREATPLLLLDDVLSELDGPRRERLSTILADSGQAVVTATSADALRAVPAQSLEVRLGEVR